MAKFPHFATEEGLKLYSHLNLKAKEGLPQAFRLYCQAALDSEREASTSQQLATCVERNGVKVYFKQSELKEVTSNKVMEQIPSFGGATLIVMDALQVSYIRMYSHT